MPVSRYPNGFANGVDILGMPVNAAFAGNVFWVNSTGGADTGKGTRQSPFATLDYAIGRCTANNGDIIVLMPNHTETITGASGITFDVAGVTVVGMGTYNQRPRFLMDGGTTVTAVISAADVTVQNCVFAAGHADIVTCFGVTGVGAHLDRCEFTENVATENFLTPIKATGTTNNEADGLKVTNCRWVGVDASGVEFIELNADVADLVVVGNQVLQDAATASRLILCATGKDIQKGVIVGNMVTVGNTSGALLISNDTSANSGVVADNYIGHHDTAGEAVGPAAGMRWFENRATAADDATGYVLPAVDS